MKTCKKCGVSRAESEYQTRERNGRVYADKSCKPCQSEYRKSNRKRKEFTCERCKKQFVARADSGQKHCSVKCGAQKPKAKGLCGYCGAEFFKRRSSSKFCSTDCQWGAAVKREEVTCSWCGVKFEKWPSKIRENNFCGKGCHFTWWDENRPTKEKHPRWGGGLILNSGYVFARDREGKRKSLQRAIMEHYLGRELKDNEVVHHINRDKMDNRIENLKLMSRAEHAREHRTRAKQGKLL